MAQGCGMKCIRNLLFIFNFFFALSGILIIVCGGYSLHWFKNTGPVIGEHYVAAPVILIVIGSIVFLVAFLGCCGAMQESYCMLMLFSVFLFLILVAEIAAGALGFVYKEKIKDLAEEQFKKSMNDYDRTDKANPVKIAWDFMQSNLACCGTDKASDWQTHIPESCCKDGDSTCTLVNAYKTGCYTTLKKRLETYSLYVGIAGICIGLIEGHGMKDKRNSSVCNVAEHLTRSLVLSLPAAFLTR